MEGHFEVRCLSWVVLPLLSALLAEELFEDVAETLGLAISGIGTTLRLLQTFLTVPVVSLPLGVVGKYLVGSGYFSKLIGGGGGGILVRVVLEGEATVGLLYFLGSGLAGYL